MGIFGFFNKDKKETLDKGLEKTKTSVFDKLARAVAGKTKVDDDVLDNLEEVLITSDVGVDTTLKIIERIEERVARDKYVSTSELNAILRDEIANLLAENNSEDNDNWDLPSDHKPYVILVVGVNGVGKTTTIGKLAWQFKQAGKKVYLGAADTFRAAAVEQLCIWGERVGVPVVKQQMGSDPASVAFDTLSSAKANGADVVLIDTAGRLHNKENLVRELQKIDRTCSLKADEGCYKKLLVIDATTGQNALRQAEVFNEAVKIDAIIMTKYDSTAKGGVAVSIGRELGLPVAFVCTGEAYENIQTFDAQSYINDFLTI
jgi:fused signal recognition particle receptor